MRCVIEPPHWRKPTNPNNEGLLHELLQHFCGESRHANVELLSIERWLGEVPSGLGPATTAASESFVAL